MPTEVVKNVRWSDQYFFYLGSWEYGGTALVTGTIRLGQKGKESVDGGDRTRQHLGPQPKRGDSITEEQSTINIRFCLRDFGQTSEH